jgi:hypothetical protein
MIVQVVRNQTVAKDNLTRYTGTLLLWKLYSRGRNLSRHNRSKRQRTEVISDNLSKLKVIRMWVMLLYRKRGLPKSECRKAIGYRPVKIRQGNGASVVVRAGESPVHGEGG